MPALHRMPVVYLAALLMVGAFGVSAWSRARMPAPALASTGLARAPSRPRVAAPVLATQADEPTKPDGILRTQDGLRRKVVVKDLDVVCLDKPQGGRKVGEPLDYFAIRFVYGQSPEDRPALLQIGPREGPPQGWVPIKSVLEWDTRLMARPTPRTARRPLVIYRDERCLRDSLAHRACARHAGRCPTEGEESKHTAGPTNLGMPILQAHAVAQPDGSTRTIFEVASLVRDQAPPPPPPAAPPARLLPALRQVDIAFAIDTTKSMQATIDAARKVAERLVADASERHRDIALRLALVEYRDNSPIFGFITKIVTGFTDPAGFLDALRTLGAAARGDGSLDEAVLDGVAAALPGDAFDPLAIEHLAWPSGPNGELATKMIVLLGDAPDHARDRARAEALAARARRVGITIATVELDRPGTLSRDEKRRYQDQWRALAEGSFRPLDKAQGFSQRVAPLCLRLEESSKLDVMLQKIIEDRIERARNLAALAAADAEGRLLEYVNSQGLTLDRVAPVLVDLHQGEAQARARPDPRFHGRKAPSVRLGWIAERHDGALMVTVELLMSRAELTILIDELTQLQIAAQGSARDLSDLLRIGNAAAAGEAGFLAVDRGAQTFADHLRRRQVLPPSRPDSLLRRSQSDLLQSDDLYRAALDARLGDSLAELIPLRNSRAWTDPQKTIDGMALVPYRLFDF